MPRIAGIDIPIQKKTAIALTYIFGVGRNNVEQILSEAHVDGNKRAKELSADEVARLQRSVDKVNTEGNLRRMIRENIERLKRIGTYRGSRHIHGLPAHGQRTRVNARTRRGKRKTVGALTKEAAEKIAQPAPAAAASPEKKK
ncbi:MAG TPA: 30S ribosomal protein S13 [Patescibacteria group bacterium]|nr:30S ribosomal protein S13 [Patescibacteria group bacterium]